MLVISSAIEDLVRLWPWLDAEAADLPRRMRHGMHVALEEAVMNVATYAFQPGDPGEIRVLLVRSAAAAMLVIEDSGYEFDPTKVAPATRPATLAEAEPGGLGLTLLHHYCRDIRYERAGVRNRLTLRFAVPPETV